MNASVAMAGQALIERLLDGNGLFSTPRRSGPGLMTLSGLLGVVGSGFFIYAAYLWLSPIFAPPMVMAFTGALFCALALMLVLFSYAAAAYRLYHMRQIKAEIANTVEIAMDVVQEDVAIPIRDNPKTAMLIALATGLMAGEKLH